MSYLDSQLFSVNSCANSQKFSDKKHLTFLEVHVRIQPTR